MPKISVLFLFLALFSTNVFSQDLNFEQISSTAKKTVNIPIDYKISRPRLSHPDWDDDYDSYGRQLTPALKKTQASLSYEEHGVTIYMVPNSIIPHAQLDTSTILADPGKLVGTWRMLKYRSIRFNDSVNIPTLTYYRLPDTLLDDRSNDEAFAVFTDNNFRLFVKAAGKSGFKKQISSKYKIENNRFIMLYKIAKSAAGVSQFGVDENGYLIMNYPSVIEHQRKGEYFSYYAVIEQYIFEKVN